MESMHHGGSDGPEIPGIANSGIAYVKPIVIEGVSAYAIHATDGTELAVVANRDLAFATVRQHDMEPVSVH